MAYQSPPPLSGPSDGTTGVRMLVGAQPNVEKLVKDHLAVQSLIRAYQVNNKHYRTINVVSDQYQIYLYLIFTAVATTFIAEFSAP